MSQSLFPDLKSDTAGWYVAHCDGGSRGNPGPAGYGAVIEGPDGQIAARLSEYLGRQTNNYAEYSGLLAVLDWALTHDVRQLRVISDSQLMVKQMKGQYKVASPGLRPLWEEARRRSSRLDRFEMRHTLRGGNAEADRLANEAMDKGMGKKQGSGSRGQGADENRGAGRDAPTASKPTREVYEGLVKNGVVHLIEGELPEGILVKVIRE
ncbi:MAG TPA: ribonuclease HI family protein [Terracidiphilus sp.]|nr:ribonuclease HI family protein [Terracidiphilus sp.]